MKVGMVFFLGYFLLPLSLLWAAPWEHDGEYYFLTKDSRDSFSAVGAGNNKFTTKYVSYEKIDFLVRGADGWRDYGRIDLEGNTSFSLPLKQGMKVSSIHLLAGGNYGNSYQNDRLLKLYKDNYYYGVLSVMFVYADGTALVRSLPVFWDWFQLNSMEWEQDGARIKNVGTNPVRKDCSLYHMSIANPRPDEPLSALMLMDSWLSDKPFSDVFAVTIHSPDAMDAAPKQDKTYPVEVLSVQAKQPDTRTAWSFARGLDGWIPGASGNWDSDAYWQASQFGKEGVAILPACAVGNNDRSSWIENKITLPRWDHVFLSFARQSAQKSPLDGAWTDGLLKVIIKDRWSSIVVYDEVFSGAWRTESVDISRFKGATVIMRFENHGGGTVKLSETTSPLGDGEDAVISEVSLLPGE